MRGFLAASFLLIITSAQVFAADLSQGSNWDRSSAMAAVHAVDINFAVDEIGDISTLADAEATLTKLNQLETRSDWALPAREAAVYQFTQSLATLPRNAVAKEVMQYLHRYQSQVLVPHEDHINASVPLFNIRAAAAGVDNGWQREESATEAYAILESNPTALVSAFLDASRQPVRAGYLDALQQADYQTVRAVQSAALDQLGKSPLTTPIIGVTAAITGDTNAIQQLLIDGQGAGLSTAFASFAASLDTAELADLMQYAIEQAPAANAALAIAAWWPELKNQPASQQLLLEQLSSPALGAAAALALARNPDMQTIRVLQSLADGDSLTARRAQMALTIDRNHLLGVVQR